MPHVPGHKYLGPGSDINSGEKPVNRADEIAFAHDIEYDAATTSEDIRQADRTAIYEFGSEFVKESDPISLLGAVGLSAKYAAETIAGVKYPEMSDKTTNKVEGFKKKTLELEAAGKYYGSFPTGNRWPDGTLVRTLEDRERILHVAALNRARDKARPKQKLLPIAQQPGVNWNPALGAPHDSDGKYNLFYFSYL